MEEAKKTEYVDSDGWDRVHFHYSWYEEKITKAEYERRLSLSTVRIPQKQKPGVRLSLLQEIFKRGFVTGVPLTLKQLEYVCTEIAERHGYEVKEDSV